jgi:hypothetical protein
MFLKNRLNLKNLNYLMFLKNHLNLIPVPDEPELNLMFR